MNSDKIITSIDIGTSKISVLICEVISENDIQIRGVGTSILKGVQKGIIKDKALSHFFNISLDHDEKLLLIESIITYKTQINDTINFDDLFIFFPDLKEKTTAMQISFPKNILKHNIDGFISSLRM